MKYESNISIDGLRLKSTPEDVRSLPFKGGADGKATVGDGEAVAVADNGEVSDVASSTAKQFGIVVNQNVGKNTMVDGKERYGKGDTPPVMTKGRIWVTPLETITARGKSAKVYVVTTAGANLGKLTSVAGSGTELVGAFWDTTTNQDGRAIVDLG